MMNFLETEQFCDALYKSGANTMPCLLGHTGIGKTEFWEQFCAKRSWDLIVIYVSQLEPSDFIGLYKINDDGRTENCAPNWLPYKEAPKTDKDKKAANKNALNKLASGFINPNGGVVFLDEVNRGHEDIRQALYQLVNKKQIHTYALPSHYKMASAANPPNGYETYEFDKALVNRIAWVKFQPDSKEALDYLENKHGKSIFLDWVKSDKSVLDFGDDDFEVNDMLLSPRITENVILLYKELEKISDKKFKRKCLETMVVGTKVQAFLAFEEELLHLNFKEVLQGKKKDKVKSLLRDKRLDVLSTITLHLAEYFSNYSFGNADGDDVIKQGKENDAVKNLTDFMTVIPAELNTVFLDALTNYNRNDSIVKQSYFKTKLKEKLTSYKKFF